MFFTQVLLRYRVKFRPRMFPKGCMWRGKYRMVRRVTNLDLAQVRDDLVIEEKNMFYLRHPYLKKEDAKILKEEYFKPREKLLNKWRTEKYNRFSKHAGNRDVDTYIKGVLNSTDSWE